MQVNNPVRPAPFKLEIMTNKLRYTIWSIFAVISIVFALANRGWQDTKWMLLAFFVIGMGYEVINYFVIRKRLGK